MSEETSSSEQANRSGQTETVSDKPNKANSEPSPDLPKVRDRWDYIELLLRPVSAFLTAITVALIGWFGQGVLEDRAEKAKEVEIAAQEQETIRNETAQNYRLYTELLSKREDAESALRRDMFMTILEKFFQVDTSEHGEADMDKRLLKLEMLALNFGESMSLSPLFIATDHAIDSFPYAKGVKDVLSHKDRMRLHSLAKRVADQQLSALFTGGKSEEFNIPLNSIMGQDSYTYPDDEPGAGELVWELEEITRTYSFNFSQPDKTYKSVHVDIEIQEKNETLPVERSFDLNYFNFPMVDNTRLSFDQRFALILTDFGDKQLRVTAISFPGKYSGQRDKPFLDDVIHRLQKSSRFTYLAEEKAGLSTVDAGSAEEGKDSE